MGVIQVNKIRIRKEKSLELICKWISVLKKSRFLTVENFYVKIYKE